MNDMPTDRLMTMLYAAVEVINSGQAAEVELEHDVADADGNQQRWAITLRREVRHFAVHPSVGE